MKYQIIYIPRVEDEIAVAQYRTKEDADHHMEYIKNRQPRVLEYHYIKEVEEDHGDVYAEDIEDEVHEGFSYDK